MRRRLILTMALGLAGAPGALAQTAGGNIYGTVTDESGEGLPAAVVALDSDVGARRTTTGAQGEFRFLNLDRGLYRISVSLAGFTTVNREVVLVTGLSVDLSFRLKVAQVADTVTVTAGSPLVDLRKRGTSTTMTYEELSQVPSARDPWAVLQAVPGVLLDRVNIAGSENGQQASYSGKGAGRADGMWNLDGIVITDMSATGSSPAWFDFDAFQEIAVTTGGGDLTAQSGGIGVSLTTKRGTNRFHGGARLLLAHDDMSFSNLPQSLRHDDRLLSPDGTFRDKADHIQQITEYGFDLGGPVLLDKVWFYWGYGKQDVRLVRLDGTPDKTVLPAHTVKLNWQASGGTMVSGFWFDGDRRKYGRDPGFGVTPTDSFSWDQANASQEGGLPGGLWKLQVDHTFSRDLFVSVKGAYYDTGFALTPRGGIEQSWTLDYNDNVGLGSAPTYLDLRPQKNITADGNYFFQGLGGTHELRFGVCWRGYKAISGYALGGNELVGFLETEGTGHAEIGRTQPTRGNTGTYWSAYVGERFSKSRFTLNVGARWDLQAARNSPATVAANETFPEIMPALVYPGDAGDTIRWSTLSPRVGLSFALDDARKTVLRASYARYGGQLSFGEVDAINPVSWGAVAYLWTDANGDKFVQPDEIDFGQGVQYSYGVNLADPGSAASPNRIDADLRAPRDREVVLGVEREVAPSFAVGLAGSWRRSSDFVYTPWLGGSCPSDDSTLQACRVIAPQEYVRNAPATAEGYTAFTYSPPDALVAAGNGGRITTNAAGYSRAFKGLELTLTRRLTGRWMGRLAVSLNDWKESWDGTPYSLDRNDGNPTATETDPLKQDGPVSVLSGESGKASFYTTVNWQVYANALWQGPWGLDLSGALVARQGGAYPVSLRLPAGGDGTTSALATSDVTRLRYDTLLNLDLRLAKTIRLGGAGFTIAAEWFNVMNSGTVLGRARYANTDAFTANSSVPGRGQIEEIMAPGILRLSARFHF